MRFLQRMLKSMSTASNEHVVIINSCKFTSNDYEPGEMNTEIRSLSPFHKLILESGMDVEWIQSNDLKVEIYAEKRILQQIESRICDETLTLDITGSHCTGPIQATVYCPDITHIQHGGVGDFCAQVFSNEHLEIRKDGPGDFYIKGSSTHLKIVHIAAGDLRVEGMKSHRTEIEHGGPGDFRIKGSTSELDIHHDGAGSLHAKKLLSRNLKVSYSGPGDINVSVSGTADIRNTGCGTIDVYGKPENVRKKNKGVGSIRIHQD
jgi:hypothetical protein